MDGADEITLTLSDGQELDATIVGTDPKTDVAILKVEADELPVLALADSSAGRVGDLALAVGNPFGIGQTATMGIISATGRGGLGIEDYENFIQTDAAINPGNSGGALVDVRGGLIGINTAIVAPSGGNQGIGLAIPTNMVRHVMEQLLVYGRVARGWLGVVIQPVGSKEAAVFGLDAPRGALVGDATPDGPAARGPDAGGTRGGLARGDVIVEFNGDPVADVRALRLRIAEAEPDSTVRLTVVRDGRERDLSVTLGEMPADQPQARGPDAGGTRGGLEGVAVSELTPQVARQLDLSPATTGVAVSDVAPGTPAAEAGLRRGDVNQEVNRDPVTDVRAFERALGHAGGDPVLLLVNRGGTTSFVVVEQ